MKSNHNIYKVKSKMDLMDKYYNYCHLDKCFSDTYEKKYPLHSIYKAKSKMDLQSQREEADVLMIFFPL